MNTRRSIRTILFLLLGITLNAIRVSAKIGEQENWYLAEEIDLKSDNTESETDSHFSFDITQDSSSGIDKLIVFQSAFHGGNSKIKVFDLGGNLISERDSPEVPTEFGGVISSSTDIEVDTNGVIYGINGSQIFSISDSDLKWIVNPTDFGYAGLRDLALSNDDLLYIVGQKYPYSDDHRIIVLDKKGNKISDFGNTGKAPGELERIHSINFLPNDNLVLTTTNLEYEQDNLRLHEFEKEGKFISRSEAYPTYFSYSTTPYAGPYPRPKTFVDNSGNIFAGKYIFNPELKLLDQDFLTNTENGYYSILGNHPKQTKDGGTMVIERWKNNQWFLQIWKRAYRTKGTPTPNVIPQPVVRSVAQRAGTNILDIDFEILDSDDDTATAGIIASVDGNFDDLTKLIVPSSLAEGTENKIGQPVATNQTHRVSWYVKGDWSELTGNLKIGLLARDARRNKPVDLHFLELPFSGGELTISRSPLKDSDISNFLLFELGRGSTSLSIQYGKIKDANGNTLAEQSGNSIISTQAGRDYFMDALGYRWATIGEVALAKEAATPGTINQFASSNQIKPRNLPGKVNEYGFDVGNHGNRAWWVVKANEVNMPVFSHDWSSPDSNFSVSGMNSNLFKGMSASLLEDSTNPTIIVGQGGKYDYWDSSDGTEGPFYYASLGNHYNQGLPIMDAEMAVPLPPAYGVSLTIEGHEVSKPLATSGNIVAVGSFYENAVYLFEMIKAPGGQLYNPSRIARITSPSNEGNEFFGLTVDLSDNILVVGAPRSNANGYQSSGAAYVFRINNDKTISHLAKLSNPAGQANDQFGYALNVSGNIIAIGANDYQPFLGNGDHGVFLYQVDGDNVKQTQLLNPKIDSELHHFGNAITIENNLLFVGAYIGNAVSIYSLNQDGTAVFLNTIKSPNPTNEGAFGASIDVHNDLAVIGAPGEFSESSIRDGVVYVYKVRSDGRVTLLERLIHPKSQQLLKFGESVNISSDRILVGAPGYDISESNPNIGSVILFNYSK